MIRFVFALMLVVAALPARAGVEIKQVTSPGGITAWLVEDHSIPFTALELRFRGGAVLDPEGKKGVASLMAALLEEGAGDLDARGFARAAEGLAASFSYGASDDTISVSARFLTENRAESVDLLRQSLVQPRFDEDAVARVRAQMLSNLRSDLKDPRAMAGRAFDARVFAAHPYGQPVDGTLESVAALSRDDLQQAHRALLVRNRVFVGAAGDITAEELGLLLDQLLGDLPTAQSTLPGPAPLAFDGGVHVVDFPTPQSVVLFGQPGLGLDDPDFFPAFVLNHILGGGGFESRLMAEVREKRGLTYGIYTYLGDKDYADLWQGSVSSANDRVAEAVAVIRQQWAEAAENGVSAEELQDAITYLTGAYPLRFDGNGPIAKIIVGMQLQGFDRDYVNTRNARIEAVTQADVARVARRLMNPELLTFVVVGQPQGLAAN
jgi:zinc protease